jgi:hypothetical protein
MKNQSQHPSSFSATSNEYDQATLKRTDRAVLKYLVEITQAGDGETCTASIPNIAGACNISKRQVQICTGRLIEAKLIERIGYDLSNSNRSKRGTIYKLLDTTDEAKHLAGKGTEKKSIKFLLIWSEE